MLKEFKAFAMRGNVVDLAVGVIIGGAFGKIIGSFIDDVITPLLLKPALEAVGGSHLNDLTILGTVKYGVFLSAVINFIIVAFAVFLLVRWINKLRKREQKSAEKSTQECPFCKMPDLSLTATRCPHCTSQIIHV